MNFCSQRRSSQNCNIVDYISQNTRDGKLKFLSCSIKMTDTKESTSEAKDIHAPHKEWDDISCPICMDHPHNAVLIICSSHDKGCRSYICDTSYRHSNCLDRFKKLNQNNADANSNIQGEQSTAHEESNSLKCPLCRGNVLGWMINKEARQYLDTKPRSCSRESCSFSGNYRDLRRHARRVHPTTRPADIDPSRQRAWRRIENQSEYGDVLSALRSELPGALVLGDYVIETGDNESEGSGPWWTTTLLLLRMLDNSSRSRDEMRGSRSWRAHRRSSGGHRRNYWGENLLGPRGDSRPIPRRRRRFMRSRSNEERP